MSSAHGKRSVRLLVRALISGLCLALFTLHIAGTPRFEIIDRIENYLYDVRVRLTMPGTVDDRIVIIDIDEISQSRLGQWPWPRDTLAVIVDQLFDHYQVSVLGLDVLFAEAEERSAERLLAELAASPIADDPAVARELAKHREAKDSNIRFAESLIARDVVTGFVFKDSLAAGEPATTGDLPAPLIPAAAIAGLEVPFVEARGFAGNLADLQGNAIAGGFFDSPIIDADGVFRRTPLVQLYAGDLYPTLALAVARVALGDPEIRLAFAKRDDGRTIGLDLEALTLGDRHIPVNQQVAVYIPWQGPQESFPFVSAAEVLDGTASKDRLEGKIALLGASAAGLLDLRSTPVGQRYIGVEAHANLVAGLLDGNIRQQPAWSDGLEFVLLLLIALLTALLLPKLAPVSALALVVAMLIATMAGNLWLWSAWQLVVPAASLLAFIVLISMLHITYGFFIEQRNKRRLSQVFGQYIPPSLVDEIDASGEEISLEGESREMSVLFSDVRGFTTISESLDPVELTQMMNEFLTPFTGAIQNQRGTIDKYMGDAVMAFWGAPLADDNHASHAVLAAFEMLHVVKQLDSKFQDKGWPRIRVGVGIASGNMNVGNMGSEFRIAYTVMGDTVNLGARLESLTKQYGVDIIVSDQTANLADEFAYRELDLVRVKGKTEPVAIFEPLGLAQALTTQEKRQLTAYSEALSAYRAQQWEAADGAFETLQQHSADHLYKMYRDRIDNFRRKSPAEDWDGVFDHLSK